MFKIYKIKEKIDSLKSANNFLNCKKIFLYSLEDNGEYVVIIYLSLWIKSHKKSIVSSLFKKFNIKLNL